MKRALAGVMVVVAAAVVGRAVAEEDKPKAPSAPKAPPAAAGPAVAYGKMIALPAGSFLLGSSTGEAEERPPHSVTVAAFEMDQVEVTVAAYEACVSAGKCAAPGAGTDTGNKACNWKVDGRSEHPINCVTWAQAAAFCQQAGKRLPTEEEWEYAARGTENRVYPWGATSPASQLCWGGSGKRSTTCAAGVFPKGQTKEGLFDMAGNVFEWTASPFCGSYSSAAGAACTSVACDRNPAQCPASTRVSRGGGWITAAASQVRAAQRDGSDASLPSSFLGFRCARTP